MREQDFERLEELLDGLRKALPKITGSSHGFVRDQFDRVALYGAETRMSVKQTEWLESLYERHVGSLSDLPPKFNPRAERRDVLGDEAEEPRQIDDAGDGIPFAPPDAE